MARKMPGVVTTLNHYDYRNSKYSLELVLRFVIFDIELHPYLETPRPSPSLSYLDP